MASEMQSRMSEASWPRLLEVQGEDEVTYTVVGGSAVSVTCPIDRARADETFAEDGRAVTHRATAKIAVSDVAAPAIGDVMTFDSLEWSVVGVEDAAGRGFTPVELLVYARAEVGSTSSRWIQRG